MIKSVLITFAFFAIASAHIDHYREECKNELNISEDSMANFQKWDFDNDDHAACYIECIFKKMKLVTDGQFNVDVIAAKLANEEKPAEQLKPEIENCIDNSIEDHCQRIYKGFNCFKEHNIYRIKQSVKPQ